MECCRERKADSTATRDWLLIRIEYLDAPTHDISTELETLILACRSAATYSCHGSVALHAAKGRFGEFRGRAPAASGGLSL